MKLDKLTIKNLASIAEACIDFESAPLSDADIFLISGDTGAGKSTILDAICLALYGKTPRMVSNRMEGATEDVKEGSTVKADDPRQLMRRDTGEAYARLIFTALDGSRWEAEWYVARARKKPEGALQGAKRVLTDLATRKSFDKVKEVTAMISSLVGLEFDQFCRTSMLAQGEFTKFLNSDDREKAAILQKVTGASEYSRIGAKIAEIASEKKRELDISRQKIGAITLLSDEDKEKLMTESRENSRLQNEMRQQQGDAEKKIKWLETDKSNREALSRLDKEMQKILAIINSEEMKTYVRRVDEWEKTIGIRHLRADMRAFESDLRSNDETLELASETFLSLLQEKRTLEKMEENRKEKAAETERKIAGMSPLKEIIEDSGKWVQMMKDVDGLNKKITTDEKEQSSLSLNLEGKLRKALATTQVRNKETATAVETATKERNDLLAALDEDALRSDKALKDNIQKSIAAINLRLNDLKNLSDLRRAYGERAENLKGIKASLEEERRRLPESRKQAEILGSRLEEARHSYDLSSRSADEYAQALRALLKKGDRCPVCNSEICGHVDDSPFAGLVKTFEENYTKARQEYEAASESLTKLESQAEMHTKAVRDEEEKLRKDNKNLSARLEKLYAEAAETGIKKSGEGDDDELRSIEIYLTSLLLSKEEDLRKTDARIASAEKIRHLADEATKKIERLKDSQLKCASDAAEALKQVEDAERRITHIAEVIEKAKTDAKEKSSLITAALQPLRLDFEWCGHTSEVSKIIDDMKQDYNNHVNLLQSLEKTGILHTSTLTALDDTIAAIRVLMPEWNAYVKETPCPTASEEDRARPENMAKRAAQLRSETASLAGHRKDIVNNIDTAKNKIASLQKDLGNMSEEDLRSLEQITPEEITGMKNSIDKARKTLESLKGSESTLREQAEKLESTRPLLKEGDDEETLRHYKESMAEKLSILSERQGSIAQMLKDDDEKREKISLLIRERDEAYRVYEKWHELRELFGDATGSRLSKIALSYVLADLVDHANPYMRMLTDRYSLVCSPGSYLIFIEDRYDGYRRRPASTISGGESFLVSLALALALGDMGQGISADTIFIDEGFGSLSGEPLRKAIDTLRSLQSRMGKHVGIISHIPELRERIPVKILVERSSQQSKSTVTIIS